MTLKKNLVVSLILAIVFYAIYRIFIKSNMVKNDIVSLKLNTLDNQNFDLASLKGKVVIVSFFQTWCGDCVREKPELEKLKKEFEGKNFEVIYITDESFEKINLYSEKFPSSSNYYQSSKNLKLIGVNRYPTTYLLDKDLNIVTHKVEGIDWYNQEIIDKIKSLL